MQCTDAGLDGDGVSADGVLIDDAIFDVPQLTRSSYKTTHNSPTAEHNNLTRTFTWN